MTYDKIILGAGLYGLYSALFCGKKNQKILVLECDPTPFRRATYINQARVHQGYHYPRSVSTAMKSAGYFERFNRDFDFCINREFKKIYATSSKYSWTNGEQFKKFCQAANIPCEELNPSTFFNKGFCDGVFMTREYTYDAMILRDWYLQKISELKNVEIRYCTKIVKIEKGPDTYKVILEDSTEIETPFLLNATYAATNQILDMLGFEKFGIKYELCEIILCDVNEKLKEYGFTVMDGPFFSIMPFGKTGLHSLTSVTFTPHTTSYDATPTFACQLKSSGYCSPLHLGNCNDCPAKPETAFPYMSNLARKYLRSEYEFDFVFEFDSTLLDFDASEIMKVYRKSLEGFDIVSASPDKKKRKSSSLFYSVFNRFSGLNYKMTTERFRILSRRVINRISAMNKTMPYRKPIYAACGLKTVNLIYKVASKLFEKEDNFTKKYRKSLAEDSFIIFTDLGYRVSMLITSLMLFFTVAVGTYSLVFHFLKNPVPGWTSTILFLSVSMFFVFMILTIVLKYLQILVNLVFKKSRYNFESIEKLTK